MSEWERQKRKKKRPVLMAALFITFICCVFLVLFQQYESSQRVQERATRTAIESTQQAIQATESINATATGKIERQETVRAIGTKQAIDTQKRSTQQAINIAATSTQKAIDAPNLALCRRSSNLELELGEEVNGPVWFILFSDSKLKRSYFPSSFEPEGHSNSLSEAKTLVCVFETTETIETCEYDNLKSTERKVINRVAMLIDTQKKEIISKKFFDGEYPQRCPETTKIFSDEVFVKSPISDKEILLWARGNWSPVTS
ncbi:MAG: hypothetical protein KDJ52_15690, partial [Anaerolineae bacterium]|nr:hypothetical protein [Anaerolineae bacterium]